MIRFVTLSDRLIAAAVPHLWTSTLFLVVVLAAAWLLRDRLTAGGRHVLVLAGIMKFALPASVLAASFRDVTGSLKIDAAGAFAVPMQFLAGTAAATVPPGRSWTILAVLLWAATALAIMIRTGLVHGRLVSLASRTALPPHARETEALKRAQRRLGVRTSIDIARSPLPEAPAVLRVFRPLIVLPAGGCDDLSDNELESLLRHECAHVARRDNLVARGEALLCALFWFHPLIWIAQRITVIERERACDEIVAASAEDRETYLIALAKFCHASIAPRLPGVSCMATARLKERMDHMNDYERIRTVAPSPRFVGLAAAAALTLFTLGSGLAGGKALADASAKAGNDPYAVRIDATRQGDVITLATQVTENATQQQIAAPKMQFRAGETAQARGGAQNDGHEVDVSFDVRPDGGEWIAVGTTITRDGAVVQKVSARVRPVSVQEPAKYTGQPISMALKDADLKDVIGTFGKLTGMEMKIDPAISGKVSVNWINVPWDQAFATLLDENGLRYRIEGKTIEVTKK